MLKAFAGIMSSIEVRWSSFKRGLEARWNINIRYGVLRIFWERRVSRGFRRKEKGRVSRRLSLIRAQLNADFGLEGGL